MNRNSPAKKSTEVATESASEEIDVASGIKEVSLTPVVTALFKPTADYLGGELKGYIKGKIDVYREAKRTDNLSHHIESARSRFEPAGPRKGQNKVASAGADAPEGTTQAKENPKEEAGSVPGRYTETETPGLRNPKGTRSSITGSRYHPRPEPYEVVPHVRICAGGAQQ